MHGGIPGGRHEIDIFVSSTGIFYIVAVDRTERMKNNVIVGNIWTLRRGLVRLEGMKIDDTMPRVGRSVFPLWPRRGAIVMSCSSLRTRCLRSSICSRTRKRLPSRFHRLARRELSLVSGQLLNSWSSTGRLVVHGELRGTCLITV